MMNTRLTLLIVLAAVTLHVTSAQLESGGYPTVDIQHTDRDLRTGGGILDGLLKSACNDNEFVCESENTYTSCGRETRSCDPGHFCNSKCGGPCTADIPSC